MARHGTFDFVHQNCHDELSLFLRTELMYKVSKDSTEYAIEGSRYFVFLVSG